MIINYLVAKEIFLANPKFKIRNFILKSQFISHKKNNENHDNFEIGLRGSGTKNNNTNLNGDNNNNENIINDLDQANNNHIKAQMSNWNIQPQLYYYQNNPQNNNFVNLNNNLSNNN
jgi:hypothetical protein